MKFIAALYFASSLAANADAFVTAPTTGRHRPSPLRDPTALAMVNPLDILNPKTVLMILKEGKVGLVKSIAGEYDKAAVRSKIDDLVGSEPVLMLSFTT